MTDNTAKEKTNTPKWVVACGGDAPAGLALAALKAADFIVCADGGGNYLLQHGLTPLAVVGDGDSLSEKARAAFRAQGTEFVLHPPEKDYTDAHLAVEWAVKKSARDLALVGACGGRTDHFLANVFLLSRFAPLLERMVILHDNTAVYCSGGLLELAGAPGDLLSIMALSPVARQVTLRGLKFPLAGRDLFLGENIGVSNIFEGDKARIEHEEGQLLVIHTREGRHA
ncbi:MAG: thiamine diphosphokinase [Clostridiales bacterium]|nr:thiamine diphosphokinase [Clostridiales bacterium]